MEERGMESGSNMMSACSRPLLDRRLKPQAEQDLKCPRCDSTNTKFCYYNNYSLTQPRHFCKTCRRYWTKGGSLRSVPVGGGCRKNSKRSNNSSSNTSTTKRSGEQPCSTSATSNEGTVTSITSNDLSSPNPNMGGSSNSYAYYNETEDLGINYGRPLGDSGYVNDFGQSGLTGFQSCLPSNLTNLQSLHYSGLLGGDHVFTRPAANRLGTMNVGDLSSIIESKPITSTSFDRDAYVHHNNHHHHNNASVESQSLSHSRLLMQQHHHQHQKSMYEAEAPQGLYEGGGYINGGGMWTDLLPYGLPNVNHTM